MTQILTCLTPDYVVQVADRRLTLATGEAVDDEACKAVIYSSDAVIGYTGLANVKPPPKGQTDLWLVDVLSRAAGLGPAIALLQEEATHQFKKIVHVARQRKQQSFVVAGWRGEASSRQPFATTVSNAENPNGTWRSWPSSEFDVRDYPLGSQSLALRVSGQPLPREGRRFLMRTLRKCLAKRDPAEPLVNALLQAMRAVARSNPRVGAGALATVLPREALGAKGFTMPGGLTIGGTSTSLPQPRAYYIPSNANTRELYAPHYVSPGLSLADVRILPRALSAEEVRELYEAERKGWQ